MERTKQIKFILVGLFLILLILFGIVLISISQKASKINYSSNEVFIQTINYPSKITNCKVNKVPYEVYTKVSDSVKTSNNLQEKLSYSDSSRDYEKKGIFNEEIQVYEVNLENTGCKGGYFKVIFSFKTLCGDEKEESIRKYIPYEEEAIFTYKNLKDDRDRISSWDYEIVSETETCSDTIKSSSSNERLVKEIRYKDEVICVRI